MKWALLLLILVSWATWGQGREEKRPQDFLANLQELYKGQTREHILTHLKNSATEHDFFRGFAAYYYAQLKTLQTQYPILQKLSAPSYQGWIGGDAHLENFGA